MREKLMTRIKLTFLSLSIVLVFSFLTTSLAFAQAKTPTDNDVNAIASQLFCPVCENTPLDVCPTQACHDWRELIRAKLAEGWTEQQIKDYFAEQYGARVLAEPPAKGLNLLVYIIPAVLIIAGAAFLAKAFQSMSENSKRSRQEDLLNEGEDNDDSYAKQIEEELNKRG